jgi:hypothetical protein
MNAGDSQIAVTYLKKISGEGVMIETSSMQTVHKNIIPDVRYHMMGHIINRKDNQRRCQLELCTGKPRIFFLIPTLHYKCSVLENRSEEFVVKIQFQSFHK